jgi:hypothetical protein
VVDHDTARAIVLRYLSSIPSVDGSNWVVDDSDTEEYDIAWLFCWTSKRLLARGTQRPGLVGNHPILVDKRDGAIYAWTMLQPLDSVLAKLREDKSSLRPLQVPPL